MNEEFHDEWIEITGQNKEDAVERACNALNTNEKYLEYVTLTRKPFKIRARKREEAKANSKTEETRGEDQREETRRGNQHEEDSFEEREDPAEMIEAKKKKILESRRERRPEEEVEERDPELARKSEKILQEMVSMICDEVKAEIKEDGERVILNLTGEETGLLIGKRGQTLEALQHLLNKMLGLDRRKHGQIVLDSDDYRERRMESLISLAQKVASKARRERRPVSLEPMSALDRRTLHMALVDEESVSTKSVGEGMNRKVVVYPKRGRGGNRSRNGSRDSSRNGPRRGRGRSERDERGESDAPRRRTGPKPRQHDSFDVPPEPSMEALPEEPDAPLMGQVEAEVTTAVTNEPEKLPDGEN